MENKEKLVCERCNEEPATKIQQIFKKGKLNNIPVCKGCGKEAVDNDYFTGK